MSGPCTFMVIVYTLTHCHTTMEFMLAWFIATPPQQLHCRCNHTCICDSCLLALFGFPYLRRCPRLFFRMKSCVNYIYQSKVSPTSFTWVDIQLIASITQGTSLIKKMIYWSKCHSTNFNIYIFFTADASPIMKQFSRDLFVNMKF